MVRREPQDDILRVEHRHLKHSHCRTCSLVALMQASFRHAVLPILALVFLLIPTGLGAQVRDQHLAGPAGELFLVSPFAHGYIHGYEDGFHSGNIDYQEGVQARRLKDFREYRLASAGYERDFGDLDAFRGGYRAGFDAGYMDGISGRVFRGLAAVRVAAKALPGDAVASIAENASFDRGFEDGYSVGLKSGRHAEATDAEFDASSRMCVAGSPETPAHSRTYCEGFVRAYSLGYRDGYLSPTSQSTRVAAVEGAR